MKTAAVMILSMSLLFGCSLDPKSGKQQNKNAGIYLSMWVLDLTETNDELLVRWDAATVDSNGNILGWELVSFLTRPNSGSATTFGPNTYRNYTTTSVPIFNWTRANTGYTGGCGNVPDSCPEHALIRAQVVYSGGPVPAIVFRESTGLACIFDNVLDGAFSVVLNCQKPNADGIVVIFSGD
jgi:hypothetical protein